jgi:lipoprotein signal peptidase
MVWLILDQLTKFLAQTYLSIGEVFIPKIAGIIGITYKVNYGLALDLGNLRHRPTILILNIAGFAVTVWAYRFFAKRLHVTRRFELAFSFAFASMGNLIDRLCFGYVRDFITWFGPGAFNLADVYWYVGVGLFVIEYVRQKRNEAGQQTK